MDGIMFSIGQRWYSEAEPELGLGIVQETESKQVKVYFKASEELRTYGSKTAPLKRITYEIGEEIFDEEGNKYTITEVLNQNEILFYKTQTSVIPETDLKSALNFSKPQDKLFAGAFDDHNLYSMRYESFLKRRAYELFKHKGLLGSRIRLIPHQVYLSRTVSERISPKVMLADEVGLGKTIEAGLILKSLIQKHKVDRALIIVPDSLVYQWFFELQNKFNLSAKTMSMEDELGIEAEQLDEGSHYIISLSRVMSDEQLRKDILETLDWDLLIVDEAHSLKWTEQESSAEYNFVKSLSKQIDSMILLSATPEILGVDGHFSRLNLLDENKFTSLQAYIDQTKKYKDHLPLISKIVNQKHSKRELKEYFSDTEISDFKDHKDIIKALIDRHGTGRVYFRNTREYLEKFNLFFPKRKLHSFSIKVDGAINDKIVFSKKLLYLKEILEKNPNEKVLLLVQSKVIALKIQRQLESLTTVPVGVFHSGQSLMERDRQAAYFADPKGARILLCTEIGSEGRNFEFAHHLFLFDLPKLPEQLEQRIGRLDRIGQKRDINIHVPFVKDSFEEVLFLWYRDVIASFSQAPKGATSFYKEHREEFHTLLTEEFNQKAVEDFIQNKKILYTELCQRLSQGHDALLDLNSFDKDVALKTIEKINEFNDVNDIQRFMEQSSDACGLHLEELSQDVFFIRPNDNMLIPSYPALDSEGFSYTSSRDLSIVRDDLKFLSWEHPLVLGTIELFTQSEIGNMAIATHQKKLGEEVFFEFIFKLEAIGSESSEVSTFLPVTPLRVLLNSKNLDVTKKFPRAKIEELLSAEVSSEQKANISKIPKETFKQFILNATKVAHGRANKYKTMGLESLNVFSQNEISRLVSLNSKNSVVSSTDIENWKVFLQNSKKQITEAQISIDSIRVIL
jgi:ATP-dependent helicase HepA